MIWRYLTLPIMMSYRERLIKLDSKKLKPWQHKTLQRIDTIVDEIYRPSREIENQFASKWELNISLNNINEVRVFYHLLSQILGCAPPKKVESKTINFSSYYLPLSDKIGLASFDLRDVVHEYCHHIIYRTLSIKDSVKFYYQSLKDDTDHGIMFVNKEKEIFNFLLNLQTEMIKNLPLKFPFLKNEHTALSLLRTAKLTKDIKKTWTIK